MNLESRLLSHLEANALKLTRQRRAVLEAVFALHEHFEAEDVVLHLRSRGHRVSRAAVYRTLPLLAASGLIREVHSAERHSHYEHTVGHDHHDHLVCTECGSVTEFQDPQIEELQHRICAQRGFDPVDHRMEILGVCRQCRRKQAREEQR